MKILAVYTQPDKPKGRGHKLLPPPVKETAMAHNIEVRQPTTFKNNEDRNSVFEGRLRRSSSLLRRMERFCRRVC